MENENENEWNQVFEHEGNELYVRTLEVESDIIEELWEVELQSEPEFTMFNKTCRMHRDIGFYSDESEGYKYTNQIAKAEPLSEKMKQLLETVNEITGQQFNGLLFNLYKDGNDYISAHRDDESNLGEHGVVALSFGAPRKFRIRDYTTKKILKDYVTKHTELMWMKGDNFHKILTHEIPIEKKVKEPRLSITFRKHLS
jgi:alkylated DNA repair dioxygenase AlkB